MDGYYTLRIKAQDGQGYWSLPKDTQVALANAPPVVTLDMPLNSTYGLDAAISGSVTGFLLDSYKIEYQKQGVTGWSILHDTNVSNDAISGELFQWDTSTLEQSETISYSLRLTAQNQAGVSTTPVTILVLVDNIPPRINGFSLSPQFISPAATSTGSPQTETTFSLQIDETNHHENKIIVIDKLSATRNDLTLATDSSAQTRIWNGSDYNGFAVEDGMVTCRLIATDAGNNETTKDVQLVLDANRYPENINITATTQILGATDSNYKVCWTPDNQKIVYAHEISGISNIFMKNVDGTGNPVQITDIPGGAISNIFRPDISPDGKKILFDTHDSGVRIFVNDIGTTNLTTPFAYGFYGNWSPDGSKIVYINDADGKITYKTVDDGSTISFQPGYFPSWSPDSQYIYYCNDDDPYTSQVYKVNIDTKQVTGPIMQGLYPELSSDGNLTAFQSGPFLIKVLDNSDTISTLVDTNVRRMAVWSPDVSLIAYVNLDGKTFVSDLDRPDQYANLTAVLNMPLDGDTDITGSAADLNFEGYTLSFGTSADALTWTTLKTSALQVKNNTLGEWDTSSLMPGGYWLKLEVWDKAQNRKIVMRKVDIANLGPNLIFDVHADPEVILLDVAGQESTTIYYTLHGSVSSIVMTMYDENNAVVKTLSPTQDPGSTYPVTLNAAWDATDNGNNPVGEGTYTFVLSAQGAGVAIEKQGTITVTHGQPIAVFSSPVMNAEMTGHVIFEGIAAGYDFDEYVIIVASLSGGIPPTEIIQNDIAVNGDVLGEWDAPDDGFYIASLVVRTQAGVESTAGIYFNIDTAAPASQITVQGESVETADKIICGNGHTIQISAQDTGPASTGVKDIHAAIDGNWQLYTAPLHITDPGEHTVQYYAVDHLDNQEAIHTKAVVFNNLTPTTSALIQGIQYQPDTLVYVNAETKVVLAADEQGGTAVDIERIEWAIEVPQPSEPYLVKIFSTYDQPFTLSGLTDTEAGLYYRSIDVTGNVEAWKQMGPLYVDTSLPETRIQTEGPEIVIGPDDQQFATFATMYVFSATDQGSGVNHTEYQIINSAGSGEWFSYIPGDKVILTIEGLNQAYYRSFDNVGNSEVAKSGDVVIDNTQPVIDVVLPVEEGVYAPPLNPSITISDDYLRETVWTLDGAAYVSEMPITASGGHLLEVMASDWAGNSRFASISFSVAEATVTVTPTGTRTPTPTPTQTIFITKTSTPTLTATVTLTPTPGLGDVDLRGKLVLPWPNPARDEVRFLMHLDNPAQVKIDIYNFSGERIASLEQALPAGRGQVVIWDCVSVAAGIYIVRIELKGRDAEIHRIAVIK